MRRAANQPTGVGLTLYAGIFCKTWRVADAGTLLPQHAHEHPHISLIMQGAVRVWAAGELLGEFDAPATVKVAARTLHQFLTLTDDVAIACIHAEDPIMSEAHPSIVETEA